MYANLDMLDIFKIGFVRSKPLVDQVDDYETPDLVKLMVAIHHGDPRRLRGVYRSLRVVTRSVILSRRTHAPFVQN